MDARTQRLISRSHDASPVVRKALKTITTLFFIWSAVPALARMVLHLTAIPRAW
jgi:hypothetical protein